MKNLTQENWFILGAGAIGCLWAVRFRQQNIPCSLIIRPESWLSYAHRPVIFKKLGIIEQFDIPKTTINKLNSLIYRLVIAVKAPNAIYALQSIKHAIAKNAIIIIISNGVNIQREMAKILPDRNIWFCCTSEGAWKDAPLSINYAGVGITWIGSANPLIVNSQPLPKLNMNIQYCNNIHLRLWQKMAVNSIINSLTVKYRCQNGEILFANQKKNYALKLANECQQVLKMKNIPTNNLWNITQSVLTNTASNISSSLQDVLNKQPTELPWINKILIDESKKLNLTLPLHTKLMSELECQYLI